MNHSSSMRRWFCLSAPFRFPGSCIELDCEHDALACLRYQLAHRLSPRLGILGANWSQIHRSVKLMEPYSA
jgi:hypothetical protein